MCVSCCTAGQRHGKSEPLYVCVRLRVVCVCVRACIVRFPRCRLDKQQCVFVRVYLCVCGSITNGVDDEPEDEALSNLLPSIKQQADSITIQWLWKGGA